MDSFELILTPFAAIVPILMVITIYYRAGLKKQIDNINQPESEQTFTFPGPESFYNTFIREPKVSQSPKAIELYKRYKLAGKVFKYCLLFSLIVNVIRSILITYY